MKLTNSPIFALETPSGIEVVAEAKLGPFQVSLMLIVTSYVFELLKPLVIARSTRQRYFMVDVKDCPKSETLATAPLVTSFD